MDNTSGIFGYSIDILLLACDKWRYNNQLGGFRYGALHAEKNHADLPV